MLDIPIELVYLIHEMNESMHKKGMYLLDQALDINYSLDCGYALDYSHAKCIRIAQDKLPLVHYRGCGQRICAIFFLRK